MVYHISSSMTSFCFTMPSVEDAMRLVKDAGFDSLDFPFSIFTGRENSPLDRPDWREWAGEIAAVSRRTGLPVTQAHSTWQHPMPDDLHYEAPWEIYYRTMEACRIVGCRHLIFHPMRQSGRVDTPTLRRRIHDWNVRWFRELLPAAERFDLIINLENTFDSHHVQGKDSPAYPYTTGEDMLRLLHDIDSPRVKLCLDTGHANISAQDIPAMIRSFGKELATLHLNDNYGMIWPVYEDLHLFPGSGRIDWAAVFAALRDIGFDGVLNMEPVAELRRMPEKIQRIQLRAAADTLRALAEL